MIILDPLTLSQNPASKPYLLWLTSLSLLLFLSPPPSLSLSVSLCKPYIFSFECLILPPQSQVRAPSHLLLFFFLSLFPCVMLFSLQRLFILPLSPPSTLFLPPCILASLIFWPGVIKSPLRKLILFWIQQFSFLGYERRKIFTIQNTS